MGKGKVIAIVIPSVLVVGIGTIALVSYFQNKNKYKVNETQWKENFEKVFNYEKRSFHLTSQLPVSGASQKFLDVEKGKEKYDENIGAQMEFKYLFNNKKYAWEQDKWVQNDEYIMFSDDATKCGIPYIKGIENNFKDFTYSNKVYTGTLNGVQIKLNFSNKKVLEEIYYTPSESTIQGSLSFNFNNVDLSDFPPQEPTSI